MRGSAAPLLPPRPRPFPPSAVVRYRAAFCELVGRARLAEPPQRDDLLRDAATIAALYAWLAGVPLLADVDDYIRLARATPRCAAGTT